MALKTILSYSPNFNPKKRTYKKIKFIIFHYTGMKKESDAIDRLKNIQYEVSSHYLIKNNGQIVKVHTLLKVDINILESLKMEKF